MRFLHERRRLTLVFLFSAFLSTGFGECDTHFRLSGRVVRAGVPVANRPVTFTFRSGSSGAASFQARLDAFGEADVRGVVSISNGDPGLTATVDGRTGPCKIQYSGDGEPYQEPGSNVHSVTYRVIAQCDLAHARVANQISPLPRDPARAGELALGGEARERGSERGLKSDGAGGFAPAAPDGNGPAGGLNSGLPSGAAI